ncbi:LOW QUALITY PROTEIN: acylamino-acid-releasing enzyme [Ciconia maguari]
MEPPPARRVPQVLPSTEEMVELYRELSRHPGLSAACLGPDVTTQYGGKYCSLYTEWSQRDLARAENVKFCRQYLIFHDGASVVYSGPAGTCSEIKDELLSRESPSGALKAVLRKVPGKEKEKQFLEVWDQNRKVKSIDLTALDKHGSVYDDDQFGCLAWSHSETHLLYVAEKKRPKAESFFQSKAPELGASDEDAGCPKKDDAPLKGEQFVYREDWGEALSTRSVPVLCALDIEGSSVSVLEGVPEHLSPGQAFWSPGDTGVVFVGWWHEPFRLGLRHCTNRRSALFYVDLTGGRCELLSEDTRAVWSPRLSPDCCRIVYLENDALGPHQQCSRLRMYDWYTKHTSTVLEAVPRQAWGAFPGIYCGALPGLCWAADSRRLVLDTAQRSQQDVFVVDTATGATTSLTADAPQGSWSVLTIDRDILVARFSTPSCPPTLKVAVLPAAGWEAQARWVCLQDAPPVPGISWGIRTLQPPPEQEHPQYGGLDFDAILLRPSEGPAAQKPPLVVMPHGGPHSVFTAGWMLYPAALCRVGFAVLLVNYRGSLGFGQDSVASLPGNVGTQDVCDVQLCVERVLQEESLDASRVALVGGSHGGFLACHLLGQFPDTYHACVVRNPVVNIASMVAATDIPDWCLTETGLPYAPDTLPDPAQWTEMLHKSPMRYVDRVRAPVLLMLGEDDRRVPPKQGLEYYRALKARGIPTRLLWYPGNNHALAGVEAEADGFMNMALWLLQHLRRRRPSAAEQGPMASGTERGAEVGEGARGGRVGGHRQRGELAPRQRASASSAQAAGGPAACYRELSRFPAVTRAALGATAGGQTFLLYTECSRPDLPRRRLLRFSRHYSVRHTGSGGLAVSRAALSAEIHNQYGMDGLRDGVAWPAPVTWLVPRAWPVPAACRSPQPPALPPSGSSARTRPRGSTVPCSAAARGRATSCWRCGTAVGAATAWTSQRWGSTGRSTRRVGPFPAPPVRSSGKGGTAGGPGAWLVPSCACARLRFGTLSLCQGPSPAWPGPARRSGCSTWPRRAAPNHGPPAPGMCWEQPGQQRRMRMKRASGSCTARTGGRRWAPAACPSSAPWTWRAAASQCWRGSRSTSPLARSGRGAGRALGGPAWVCGTSPAVAQALWSPDDRGVVFVGWWHEPFRLGLSACSNRRSGIFHLDLAGGHCELLSAECGAACSPRLSPDGRRLLYLQGGLGGPHRQCLQLRMLTWQTRQSVTVLDVVREPTEAFAGLYTETLPLRCWAADSRRAVLGTPQRSRTDLLLVDTEVATVTNLTAGLPEGCWELLTLQWDLLVATCSAPHRPPSLVVAVLPPAGRELPLRWVPVEDAPTVPGVTWKTLTVRPPCSGQSPTTPVSARGSPQHLGAAWVSGTLGCGGWAGCRVPGVVGAEWDPFPGTGTQAFEALLLSPPESTAPHPLVVCPHGGPHAVFDARWRPSMAALCWLGFAVLLVNYRGSLGFGQAGISSLLARVGEQDVADTQLAVEQALRSEPLDPRRLALLAGSHGAFIALHLLAREPERYQACALRSPVSNLPALLGTSDIPDWRYVSLGLPYSFERVPRAEEVAAMLLRSPIAQAARVRTPVLLCVGAQDRRVSPTQALELYRVLRARGVPVRLLWYPAGGHALASVETEADVFGNCARWLLRHLGQPRQDGPGRHSP